MKTKFIKKLSLVLAVAMVLSVLYPAAGAFAASKPKLNAKSKTLILAVEGRDQFDFNISNKKSGWKYTWESSNEDVVEVNEKNGLVTAVGVGKAKVTVYITDKKGEELYRLSADVTVKDNIKTLEITNKPEGALKIGEEHDFNRSYVTNAGKTKGSTSVTRWEVKPADENTPANGATIVDDSGLFVATKPGTYTVIARAFQSKAKYQDWLNGKDTVLASASVDVTVKPSIVGAKQVDLDTIEVTFDTEMKKEDLEKNLTVSYLVGTTTKIKHQVKAVSVNDKVATVDLYGDLLKNTTYVVEYPEMGSAEFKSSAVDAKEVVSGEIVTKTAQQGVETAIEYKLFDNNGVNVAAAFADRVAIESSNTTTAYFDTANKKLTMFKVGDTTTIKLTYHTYDYDLTTGKEVGSFTIEGIVTCIEKATDNVGTLNAYTVVKSGSTPDFSNVKHTLAAGDTGYQLFVKLLGKKADGSDKETINNGTGGDGFTFASSDERTLIVNPATGSLYPIKEGTAAVVVYYNGSYVGSCTITIIASRRVTAVNLSEQSFKLSNAVAAEDEKIVTIEVKDQLEEDYRSYTTTVTLVGRTTDYGLYVRSESSDNKIVFRGANNVNNVEAGAYTYAVAVKDTVNNITITKYIYVSVQEPSSNSVAYYAVEPDKSEYDTKVSDTDTDEIVTLRLYAYASNGVRLEKIDATTGGYTVVVKDPNGTEYTYNGGLAEAASDKALTLNLIYTQTVSGKTILVARPNGTYVITAKDSNGKPITTTYFTVKNTQPAAKLAIETFQSSAKTILAAINECFKITVDGKEYTVASENDYVVKTVGASTIYVEKVTVYVPVGSSYFLKYDVKVDQVIKYNPEY